MAAIDRARAHFEARGMRVIDVPEWGEEDGNPLMIYAAPMTLAEKRRLYKGATGDDLTVLADVVIMKSCDAEGKKLFTVEDKHALLHNVDPDVLARITEEITASETTVEEAEKN